MWIHCILLNDELEQEEMRYLTLSELQKNREICYRRFLSTCAESSEEQNLTFDQFSRLLEKEFEHLYFQKIHLSLIQTQDGFDIPKSTEVQQFREHAGNILRCFGFMVDNEEEISFIEMSQAECLKRKRKSLGSFQEKRMKFEHYSSNEENNELEKEKKVCLQNGDLKERLDNLVKENQEVKDSEPDTSSIDSVISEQDLLTNEKFEAIKEQTKDPVQELKSFILVDDSDDESKNQIVSAIVQNDEIKVKEIPIVDNLGNEPEKSITDINEQPNGTKVDEIPQNIKRQKSLLIETLENLENSLTQETADKESNDSSNDDSETEKQQSKERLKELEEEIQIIQMAAKSDSITEAEEEKANLSQMPKDPFESPDDASDSSSDAFETNSIIKNKSKTLEMENMNEDNEKEDLEKYMEEEAFKVIEKGNVKEEKSEDIEKYMEEEASKVAEKMASKDIIKKGDVEDMEKFMEEELSKATENEIKKQKEPELEPKPEENSDDDSSDSGITQYTSDSDAPTASESEEEEEINDKEKEGIEIETPVSITKFQKENNEPKTITKKPELKIVINEKNEAASGSETDDEASDKEEISLKPFASLDANESFAQHPFLSLPSVHDIEVQKASPFYLEEYMDTSHSSEKEQIAISSSSSDSSGSSDSDSSDSSSGKKKNRIKFAKSRKKSGIHSLLEHSSQIITNKNKRASLPEKRPKTPTLVTKNTPKNFPLKKALTPNPDKNSQQSSTSNRRSRRTQVKKFIEDESIHVPDEELEAENLVNLFSQIKK